MKKEIRPEIREFILNEVNETLARLGVSEPVKETREYEIKYDNTLHYEYETAPIRQMPMMFKRLVVQGYLVSVEVEEDNRLAPWAEKNDIVVATLDYRYQHFDMGENGCKIGRIIFAVKKDLPATFEDFAGEDGRRYYVRKIEGLTILKKTMVTYIFLAIFAISAFKVAYEWVKTNERNGMFYYAVFGLYLKEKGLTKEEIEEERMKWAHYHNYIHKLLWPNLYRGFITENDFRGDIVKLMKELDID